jgi:hypothetical protein
MDHEVLTSRFPPAANALKTPVVCLFMQQIECACHGVLAHVPRPFSSAVDLLVNAFMLNVGFHFLLVARSLITGLNGCHAGRSTAWVFWALCFLSNAPCSRESAPELLNLHFPERQNGSGKQRTEPGG